MITIIEISHKENENDFLFICAEFHWYFWFNLCFFTITVIIHADSVGQHGVGRCSPSVCLEHNSKMNDPKVFKLGARNDPGIS